MRSGASFSDAFSRRSFLKSAAAVTIGFRGLQSLLLDGTRPALAASAPAGFGLLVPDRAKLLDLPAGFSYTVISRMGDAMDDGFVVPGQPDGMGAFPGPDGRTIIVRNHELDIQHVEHGPFGKDCSLLGRLARDMGYDLGADKHPCVGGTTTLVYDTQSRKIERQFLSLACTKYNCAGGPTPWGTWLTCEETTDRTGKKFARDHGYVFEVPATAEMKLAAPIPIKEMGRFRHEAVAVDPRSGVVYLTEDIEDGIFYRFIPKVPGRMHEGGRLQALVVRDKPSLDTRNWRKKDDEEDVRSLPPPIIHPRTTFHVKWMDLEEIDSPKDDLRHRGFKAGAARFARAEGIWHGRDAVYFACTTGGFRHYGQIWRYLPSPDEGMPGEEEKPGVLELFIESNDKRFLENADNLTVAPWGDLIVCEDNGRENHLVGVTPDGRMYRLGRNAKDTDELCGCVFSPDGSTLFVNFQKNGVTAAITGPWKSAGRG